MTAEEFIIEKWNKCVCMNHIDYPGNIIMIYDPIHIRKMKLKSLDNIEIVFKKSDETKILFYIDYKNHSFKANNIEIWNTLEDDYNLEQKDIRNLMTDIFLKNNKMRLDKMNVLQHYLLLDEYKLKVSDTKFLL